MAITAPLPIVTEPDSRKSGLRTEITAGARHLTPVPPADEPLHHRPAGVSATLAAGQELDERRQRGERVLPMAFGEAGVPAAPILRYALASASHQNGYGPVAGTAALREAAAGYWTRRGLPTSPGDVVCGPGSKALLYGLLLSLGGSVDVAVARPSWVSYAAQATLTGTRPVHVPVPAGAAGVPAAGGVPDPDLLEVAAKAAAADGRRLGAVIVTLPDNPTGTLASAGLVQAVTEVARRHDMLIISDEIYRDLAFDGPDAVTSPASLAPERTVITSGLSKNLALGGWRLGVARVPSGDGPLDGLRESLLASGSEIWSAPAAPVQQAAALAFEELPDITERVKVSRRLHSRVAREVASAFSAAGALVAPPSGAFYLYPDFGPHRDLLAGRYGVKTSADLAGLLLEKYGIGVLPGSAFGDADDALRMRVATSRLYGDTPSRQEAALASLNPVALPWIAESLDWISGSLADLVS
ncbi:MAG: pyridoxal phosphate-dependent aminotransferase [Streptosporangiales bacterium]|nr:pyridoxal phosphate-dependent aminotransferase [Streptosporangiales bacterium]